MPWGVRRSLRLGKGLRLNFGKRGTSTSVHVPGSGVSYSTWLKLGFSRGFAAAASAAWFRCCYRCS